MPAGRRDAGSGRRLRGGPQHLDDQTLDSEAIVASVSKTGCCVTAEEHSIVGGLGSAVCEVLAEHRPAPVERVGTMDTFGESGKPDELMARYGLTAEHIADSARKSISRKRF